MGDLVSTVIIPCIGVYPPFDTVTNRYFSTAEELCNFLNSNSRFYAATESVGKSAGVYYRGSAYGTTGWTGLTSWTLTNASTIKQSDVQMNFTYLSGYTQAQNTHVASHELGHALGLTHATVFTGPRVMHPGSYSYTSPQPKDIASLAQLY